MNLCYKVSDRAAAGGWTWAAFQYLFLPSLLLRLGAALGLGEAELNGLYFALNFCAAVCIFRRFLAASAAYALKHFGKFLLGALPAFLVNLAASYLLGLLLEYAAPEFANANDAAILEMYRARPALIFVGAVCFVPVAEECLFRGLIFGGLRKTPALAWTVSVLAFAAVHVLGYVGSLSGSALALCFGQYLIPGLCLAWAYQRSGSILAPIAVHAATNAAAFWL